MTVDYTYLCMHCWEDDTAPRLTLTLPRSVHCQGCGQKVGRLTEAVDHHRAIRAGDTVNDYKTGEELAEIDYASERVIERD